MRDRTVLDELAAALAGHEVTQDSRKVRPGDIFFLTCRDPALRRVYAQEAERRGAAAVVVESGRREEFGLAIPVIAAEAPRRLLAELAGLARGRPGDRLLLVGVTGTSGKTTAVEFTRAVFEAAGWPTACVGSLHPAPGAEGLTTPPAPELQKALARFVAAGKTAAVLEVSSHGIDQDRVAGLRFRGAILTNLGRDHLDYHGTLARYWEVKARLFRALAADAVAALPAERRVALVVGPLAARVVPYGVTRGEVHLVREDTVGSRRRLRLSLSGALVDAELTLPGPGPLRSLLAAAALGLGLGLAPEAVAAGAAQVRAIPGRMEPHAVGGRTVWIDYAHNPVGLESCLEGVRSRTAGEVWHVFGGRGGRDRGKLPFMGRISARLADHTILTSDLPGPESAEELARLIERGMWPRRAAFVGDRYEALALAFAESRPGDAIVLTGRGHEGRAPLGPVGRGGATAEQPSDGELVRRLAAEVEGAAGGRLV